MVLIKVLEYRDLSLKLFLQLEKVGKIYYKLKCFEDESRCYEQIGKFNLVVEILVENGFFEMVIDILWCYKILREVIDVCSYL